MTEDSMRRSGAARSWERTLRQVEDILSKLGFPPVQIAAWIVDRGRQETS
ncbi:hypothetical protein ACQPXH_17225 [Nocardia sp. CA-135953]